ncbi:hypothetical protein ACQ4WN_24825 [Janthinobacterium sp. LB3P118]
MAWWYSGFYKNAKALSQPHVLVLFRKITDGMLSDDVIQRRLPLTVLGQIRIGSIWQNDRCRAETSLLPKQFAVNFSPGKWRFTSFAEAQRRQALPPYPMEEHPLLLDKDRNSLLEFALPDGGKLIVPCIEFFSRCFGRSGELKRVLATYPWDGQGDTATNRLYAPLDTPEEPGQWQVRLRRRLHNGDVVFLAHAKYDPYTQFVAKGINAKLEASYDPKSKNPAFIDIGPWYEGPAELKVEGIPFNNGKSFLALRVLGMSDPKGALVLRARENSRDAENPAPEGSPEAWAGAPVRQLLKYPEIIDLTGDVEPDADTGAIEIQDPDFEVLGDARPVINVKPEQATTKAGAGGKPSDVSTVSGGDAYGSGKGVGYASIHARPVFESHGTLRDMWDAMVHLHTTRPEFVQELSWFTFADGFSTIPVPELIALEPFKEDDDATATARRFPFMDPSVPLLRGILVARLIVPGGPTYIVEVARRPRKISAEDGTTKDAEEAFQGLVFRLNNENELKPWLRYVAAQIRHENGVFKRLTASCPGIADSFSHRLSSKITADSQPCASIVLGALAKLNSPTVRAGTPSQ